MQALPPHYYARIFAGWQDEVGVRTHQRLRKQLFVDGLGWRLDCDGQCERDEFDSDRATYCLLFDRGKAIACWRAIATTEDYLAKGRFPQLATLRPYPSRPDVWEISRLGVLPHTSRTVAARYVYALMVHFALARNARALVGVVDACHGRNMAVHGMRLRRYGPPQLVGYDVQGRAITAYCAELRLSDQKGARFEKLMGHIDKLEISDDAHVLGSARISA